MSTAKTHEFFDTLRAACARQFRFNPRRITAEMRYVGKEGHGKDIVHIFRDANTHSQIVLKNTFATLRETHDEHPHWSETEKAHYQCSDADIDAEMAAKQATLDYTHHCALYLDHRAQLLTHYKDSPSYQQGSSNPREAAQVLIVALMASQDPRLLEFSEHMKSNDVKHLAHLLIAPCHLDFSESSPS